MALWLVRAGKYGEYEQKFLTENRVYLTWDGLNHDLSKLTDKPGLYSLLQQVYPEATTRQVGNWVGQIWPFAREMDSGDWIVLPSKMKSAIHIAEMAGPYVFQPKGEDPYFHYRNVNWIETDIPRSNFDQDILYSFGAFMTICRITRNDAEKRVRAMGKAGWKSTAPPGPATSTAGGEGVEAGEGLGDLEEVSRDQIAKLIISKFKGHSMARLVDAILLAQGYSTHISPEGPDKGVDILAAPGPLGFGEPRICVQVKSGAGPVDRPMLDQLIGTMQNVSATQGLLVSWGGFKSSIDREKANQFFRVRLWDQDSLIDQLLTHYDKLDDDLRAELPLKRIWTIAAPQEEG